MKKRRKSKSKNRRVGKFEGPHNMSPIDLQISSPVAGYSIVGEVSQTFYDNLKRAGML